MKKEIDNVVSIRCEKRNALRLLCEVHIEEGHNIQLKLNELQIHTPLLASVERSRNETPPSSRDEFGKYTDTTGIEFKRPTHCTYLTSTIMGYTLRCQEGYIREDEEQKKKKEESKEKLDKIRELFERE